MRYGACPSPMSSPTIRIRDARGCTLTWAEPPGRAERVRQEEVAADELEVVDDVDEQQRDGTGLGDAAVKVRVVRRHAGRKSMGWATPLTLHVRTGDSLRRHRVASGLPMTRDRTTPRFVILSPQTAPWRGEHGGEGPSTVQLTSP